eukprot:UN33925
MNICFKINEKDKKSTILKTFTVYKKPSCKVFWSHGANKDLKMLDEFVDNEIEDVEKDKSSPVKILCDQTYRLSYYFSQPQYDYGCQMFDFEKSSWETVKILKSEINKGDKVNMIELKMPPKNKTKIKWYTLCGKQRRDLNTVEFHSVGLEFSNFRMNKQNLGQIEKVKSI